jgi:carbamoyl-phosphate synthase small subunit
LSTSAHVPTPAAFRAREPAILVLEDGRTFPGQAYGALGQTVGEAVFATGMSGYQETLTDPSYHRQVVVMTAPHIGNTGFNDQDSESARIWVAGFVVRDPAVRPSSWRSRGSLEDELVEQKVVGISGIDTRALTRHLRERGAMRVGVFSGELAAKSEQVLCELVRSAPPMSGAALAGEVTTARPYVVPAVGRRLFTVAALDLGIKAQTPVQLSRRGIEVHVLPATSTFADIAALGADGVFFSNGPGDPASAEHEITLLREVLAARVPFFGICFGNQLLGINQPVLDRRTGRVEITAHNHGFAVDAPIEADVPAPADAHGASGAPRYGRVRVSHIGLNDLVVEGLECLDIPAFSVQYHPEAAAGPHDSEHLFDRFVQLMTAAAPAPATPGRP